MNIIDEDALLHINYVNVHHGGWVTGNLVREPDRLLYFYSMIRGDMPWPHGGRLTAKKAAAAYAFYISSRHIFWDGNKRTGMQALLLILELNGKSLIGVSQQEIIDVAIRLGEGKMKYDELYRWVKINSRKSLQLAEKDDNLPIFDRNEY